MFALDGFAGKRVAIFGLGRSGLACLSALRRGGAEVFVWDENLEARHVAQNLGGVLFNLEVDPVWEGISCLVLAPGVPLTDPRPHPVVLKARALGVKIVGDTALFCDALLACGAQSVGITGTNGKSTTTALIGHILSSAGRVVSVGGNIGTAVFSLPAPTPDRIYVLELSSYQIDLMSEIPLNVGVLLNLSEDHLDRHGTMERYAAVKARLFEPFTPERFSLCGIDDPWSAEIFARLPQNGNKTLALSTRQKPKTGVCVLKGILEYREDGQLLETYDLRNLETLPGEHNHQNAAAAYGACRGFGLSGEDIFEGMKTFPGLDHRLKRVCTSQNVTFINDSKATNAEAAERALVCFDRIYWILGGLMKTGGISSLTPHFSRVCRGYVIGRDADVLAQTLEENKVPYKKCGDLTTAVTWAFRDALREGKPGAVVLLSPACASFDHYPNFEVRGQAFVADVERLVAQEREKHAD